MSTPAAPSSAGSSRPTYEQEARLLAELVRSSRLALLFAATGTDKTALLKHDLLPLLHRRASDRVRQPPRAGAPMPFPDRRNRSPASLCRRRGELVIYFDAWDGQPLTVLLARIHEAARSQRVAETAAPSLADTLHILSSRLDLGFIILLDRFEQLLQAATERGDMARFADELVAVINRPSLAANVLISVEEAARPGLASLRSRIPGFDDFCLNLAPRVSRAPVAPAPSESPGPTAPARETIQTRDVYALIQSKLIETATAAQHDRLVSRHRGASPAPASVAGLKAAISPTPPAAERGRMLGRVLQWLRRRLRLRAAKSLP